MERHVWEHPEFGNAVIWWDTCVRCGEWYAAAVELPIWVPPENGDYLMLDPALRCSCRLRAEMHRIYSASPFPTEALPVPTEGGLPLTPEVTVHDEINRVTNFVVGSPRERSGETRRVTRGGSAP